MNRPETFEMLRLMRSLAPDSLRLLLQTARVLAEGDERNRAARSASAVTPA